MDFARAFGFLVANSSFLKKEERFIIICSSVAKTLIDFFLLGKGDRALCKECKVIPSENLMTQHKLQVMNLKIKKGRKHRGGVEVRHRIK